MTPRNSRTATPPRNPVVPMHRGPQAFTPVSATTVHPAPFVHAPNAALLIDFDNVTMGIRSDLQTELRSLLSSDIIKGKVAVQRAYADWRRYPQYIVPLTESSIDLIYAPAYGSSKKNATDIRLAIDALELVFTRPEIGTFILLSGDSDFSSLVIKLKEYGKYVIGVGIRESSSDLLVMNCDEYFSYNALAGLVKSSEDEAVKRDPWELVAEAVVRMKRNGDVMRADRLKQVMQEIDSSFDEKDLGMAKFSRFVQEAAQRGLLTVSRLENGQLEIGVGTGHPAEPAEVAAVHVEEEHPREPTENGRRSRRGGRGRGRRGAGAAVEAAEPAAPVEAAEAAPARRPTTAPSTAIREGAMTGERLTRDEAFNLVRRAVDALTAETGEPAFAPDVRHRARELLGRDSETLSDRYFPRILRDMHDADLIDLRKRGDTFEVSPAAAPAGTIAEQLEPAAPPAEPGPAATSAAHAASLRRGIRPRGGARRAPAEVPPELLSVGVVNVAPATKGEESSATSAGENAAGTSSAESAPAEDGEKKPRTRARARKKTAAKKTRASRTAKKSTTARRSRAKEPAASAAATEAAPESAEAQPAAENDAPPPAAKKPRRKRAARKKTAAKPESET